MKTRTNHGAEIELEKPVLSQWPRPWRPWKGRLCQKIEYDVLLLDGTIVSNYWPNSGKLKATDGSGRSWTKGIAYRRAANPSIGEIPKWFRNNNP